MSEPEIDEKVKGVILKVAAARSDEENKRIAGEPKLPKVKGKVTLRTDEEPERNTKEVVKALGRHKEIFSRGALLVAWRRGHNTVELLSAEATREAVEKVVCFVAPEYNDVGVIVAWKDRRCTRDQASLIHKRGVYTEVKEAEAVTHSVSIAANGSVRSKAGYHTESRTLVMPGAPDLDDLPESPDVDDARAALKVLGAPVREYPWGGRLDQVAFLAMILTPLARSLYSGPTPAFIVTAPTKGTGKTKMIQVAKAVATGDVDLTSYNGDQKEMEKVFAALMVRGADVVLLDNARGSVGGVAIEALVTSSVYMGRVLGHSKMFTARPPTIMVSGNNAQVTGDMARRAIEVRLDAAVASPWARGFEFDPVTYALDHRAELLAAGVTVLRYGLGLPRPEKVSGGFAEWWTAVGHPLQALSGCDVSEAFYVSRGDSADPHADEKERLVRALWEVFGGTEFLAKDVLTRAGEQEQHGDLKMCVEDSAFRGSKPNIRSVGRMLGGGKSVITSAGVLRRLDKAGEQGAIWLVDGTN